jgi:hypothetical protein
MDRHEQIRRQFLVYDIIVATYVAVRYENSQPARTAYMRARRDEWLAECVKYPLPDGP